MNGSKDSQGKGGDTANAMIDAYISQMPQEPAPTKNTRHRRGIEIQMAVERMGKMKENDIIQYSELTKLIDRDVRAGKPGYGSIMAARKILRAKGIHFDAVSDRWENSKIIEGGLRRLTDAEALRLVTKDVNNVRARSVLALDRLSNMNFDGLDTEAQVLHNTYQSIARFTAAASSQQTVEKTKEEVRHGRAPIPTQKMVLLLPRD